MNKLFRISLYVSLFVAFLVSSVVLYAALQHNPQGEFYSLDNGRIEFAYIAMLFFSWFIPVFIVCSIVGATVVFSCQLLKRLYNKFAKSEEQ